MRRVITNGTGNPYRDVNGKIYMDVPLEGNPLQNGLVFWSNSQPEQLDIINSGGINYISNAYDIRDVDHNFALRMTQGTAANRAALTTNGEIDFTGLKTLLTTTTSSVRSLFVVVARVGSVFRCGLGSSSINAIINPNVVSGGSNQFGYSTTYTTGSSLHYINTTKKTSGTVVNINDYKILHSLEEYGGTINLTFGTLGGASDFKVLEWGWYDRVLTEKEALFNVNALNQRYNIF